MAKNTLHSTTYLIKHELTMNHTLFRHNTSEENIGENFLRPRGWAVFTLLTRTQSMKGKLISWNSSKAKQNLERFF